MGYTNFIINTHMNEYKTIEDKLHLQDDGKAVEFLRDDVYRLSQPYVPQGASKNLNELHTFPNAHTIHYSSPYAHYQYIGEMYISPKLGVSGIPLKSGRWWSPKGEKKIPSGKQMHHTIGGPQWDKKMMNDRRNDIVKDLENFIKKGGK